MWKQNFSFLCFQNWVISTYFTISHDPLGQNNSLSQANAKPHVSRKLKKNTGTQFSETAIMPQIP